MGNTVCAKCGAKSRTEWKGKLCNKCFQAWKQQMIKDGKWVDKEREPRREGAHHGRDY